MPLVGLLPTDTRSKVNVVSLTILRTLALVGVAILLILVLLPAVLGAAGIHVAAPA